MNRLQVDRFAQEGMRLLTLAASFVVIVIAALLLWRSMPLLREHSLTEILFSSKWFPMRGNFGFLSFIVGTLVVTGISMTLAVPICILSAIYLSEYASSRVRDIIKPLVDLLAGIPSVVYGLWGVSFVVPLVRNHVGPLFGVRTSGYNALSGGIVLAIMVFPIIISVTEEVLRAVPFGMRESSYALGATKWQTVKHVVLKSSSTGVLAAVILGLSRAFGETMAVIMVVGNVAKIPGSVFDPAYPLPALIANNYGETMSLPFYDSALMLSALLLLLVVGGFTVIARVIQRRILGW